MCYYSIVSSIAELYPIEYQNIVGPSRSWDATCRLHVREETPRVPPTTLQISVLDIEPAVWSTSLKPSVTYTRKNSSSNRNVGEISHAEVARRTEAALKRNLIRQAEKEERRLQLKEAREGRNNSAVQPPPKKPSRRKRAVPRETGVELNTASPTRRSKSVTNRAGHQSPRIGPKSVMQKLRAATPPKAASSSSSRRPASPASSSRRSTAAPTPRATPSNRSRRRIINQPSEPASPPEDKNYESQVFHSVSEEIANCLDMSPAKKTMISALLQPKLKESEERRMIENSYETSVVNHLQSEVPNLWRANLIHQYPYCGNQPPMDQATVLSRKMCNNALKTLNCTSNDDPAVPSSTKKLGTRKRPRSTAAVDHDKNNKQEPIEGSAPFTPAFNRVTFGKTPKNGFHQNAAHNKLSPNEVGPKNLRRLSKDFSPQKGYVYASS